MKKLLITAIAILALSGCSIDATAGSGYYGKIYKIEPVYERHGYHRIRKVCYPVRHHGFTLHYNRGYDRYRGHHRRGHRGYRHSYDLHYHMGTRCSYTTIRNRQRYKVYYEHRGHHGMIVTDYYPTGSYIELR